MGATHALELRVITFDDVVEVVPYVDGRSLVALVGAVESANGYSPAGCYGGLVPAAFRYGPAGSQWYGHGRWPYPGRAWVLACDCHEAGCWPFEVTVRAEARTVSWEDPTQPHRPEWDYTALGTLTFDRAQYDVAVAGVAHLFR
jgi:hypothetical protein